MDLLSLPINEMTSLDGQKKAEMVKKFRESVRQHIEKKNEQYATKAKANKGRPLWTGWLGLGAYEKRKISSP